MWASGGIGGGSWEGDVRFDTGEGLVGLVEAEEGFEGQSTIVLDGRQEGVRAAVNVGLGEFAVSEAAVRSFQIGI
jgi:hypothetical protein